MEWKTNKDNQHNRNKRRANKLFNKRNSIEKLDQA